MVWAGTQTFTRPAPNVLEITSTGFDADAEEGTVLDIFAATVLLGLQPDTLAIYCTATHATAVTDIVDFAVQGSAFNTRFTDIGTSITDADADNGGTAAEDSVEVITDISSLNYRYYKVLAVTVGVGNTLTMKWRLSNNNL